MKVEILFAGVFGLIGGMIKYITLLQSVTPSSSVTKAIYTALLCGIAGAAGGELYKVFKPKIVNALKCAHKKMHKWVNGG